MFVLGQVAFWLLQIFREETRVTVPIRVILNRSIFGAMWYALFGGSVLVAMSVYIPIWFQAIKGLDAIQSGVRLIPLILSMVLFIVMSGALVQKFGYYVPFMLFGSVFVPIGAGLISTWTPDIKASHWLGYQVVMGIGLGSGLQQSMVAAQASLPRKDIPVGTSLVVLAQTLGGGVFTSVLQNVINSALIKGLRDFPIPLDSQDIINAGATNIRKEIPAQYLEQFLVIYNHAITRGFLVAVGCGSVLIIGALSMKWIDVRQQKKALVAAEHAADPAAVEANTRGAHRGTREDLCMRQRSH